MRATIDIPIGDTAQALRGLVTVSKRQIVKYKLPKLYETGIIYKPERKTENWQTAKETFDKKYGDCEDLAVYRSAELQLEGINAWPIIVRTGKHILHAVVQNLDTGKIEDPTRIIKNRMKRDSHQGRIGKMNIRWSIHKLPNGGFRGVISIPLKNGQFKVSGVGSTPAKAMKWAASHGLNMLQMPFAMQMPMMQNPGMFTLMQQMQKNFMSKGGTTGLASLVNQLPMTIPGAPPEAQAGLIGMKILATIASNPKIKKAYKKIKKRSKKWLHKLHLWGYANAIGL